MCHNAKFQEIHACKGNHEMFSVHMMSLAGGCSQIINGQCRLCMITYPTFTAIELSGMLLAPVTTI